MDGSWIFQGEEEGFCQVLGNFCVNLWKGREESTADSTFEFLRAIIRGKDTFRIIIIHGGNNLYAR